MAIYVILNYTNYEIGNFCLDEVIVMKNVLGSLIAVVVICVGITACGNNSESGKNTGVATVSADYLDDVKEKYPNYVDASETMKVNSSDYDTAILFHTDGNVQDFRVFSVELNIDDNGNTDFIPTEVFRSAELKKESPIAVPLNFTGDMSLNGFSYKGPDGNIKTFTIGISGKDGSLVINAENFALPE